MKVFNIKTGKKIIKTDLIRIGLLKKSNQVNK